MGVRCVTLLSLPQETPRKNEVLGTAWKLQFFQPKAAALFLEEVVVFALQAVFFFPGSGQVIKESQMHFSYRLVLAPVKSWQREKEMLGTMTHLFLRQILRAGLLICQEMAKYHYIQDQTVSSSPYIASRTVSNTHTHTHTHTSRSVVSDSLRPHGLYPTRLLHPWDFPGMNTRVGCRFLLHKFTF